jgi:hypothetical protein
MFAQSLFKALHRARQAGQVTGMDNGVSHGDVIVRFRKKQTGH